jgi:hypothetical protein
LKHIKNIVSEAILLEQVVESHVDDRRARIEKRYNQRKRGKRGKAIGDYFLNISLQDLRDQQTEFLADGEKKDIRQQLRSARSLAIRELDAIKKEWREKREVTIEGLPKRLQFKQWLEYTGKCHDPCLSVTCVPLSLPINHRLTHYIVSLLSKLTPQRVNPSCIYTSP